MYSFYDTIKKQIDLQDLVEYMENPLNHLNLLQIKLQEYKDTHGKSVEIEELIRQTDKLEKNLFPEVIENYCNLSLEFRNVSIIKQYKDKIGNNVLLTSKDLLLKNIAKLIEHIEILEENFYQYLSFNMLVKSRVIQDLGYQKNYIDEKKQAIVLENKYKFSKEDSMCFMNKQLSGKEKIVMQKSNIINLFHESITNQDFQEEIFEKKVLPLKMQKNLIAINNNAIATEKEKEIINSQKTNKTKMAEITLLKSFWQGLVSDQPNKVHLFIMILLVVWGFYAICKVSNDIALKHQQTYEKTYGKIYEIKNLNNENSSRDKTLLS